MKPELLLVCRMMPHVMAALEEAYTVHKLYEAEDKEKLVAEVAPRIRAIGTNGHYGASHALVEALPNLEIIGCFGVGVDAIDLGHAARQGVVVTNTPEVLNDDVANLAVVLILAVSRMLVRNDRVVRDGRWPEGDPPLARSIRGRTAGILGLGRIGKDIASKLEAFGMKIAYHGRAEQPGQPYRYYPDLVAMATDSDYLVVICPGGAATHHLVSQPVIEALGPEGTLINVARGSVVDEAALVPALLDGRLGFAGLDVFEAEPNVPEALWSLDNVVLQPHQGSATVECRRAMGDLVVDNLAAHFAGEPVLTPIGPAPVRKTA